MSALTPQRRFDREKMRVAALAYALKKATYGNVDSHRASGDCVCAACGFIYHDHPSFDPKCPTLVVLCDGTYVKL